MTQVIDVYVAGVQMLCRSSISTGDGWNTVAIVVSSYACMQESASRHILPENDNILPEHDKLREKHKYRL